MYDLLIALAFLMMLIAPAIVATMGGKTERAKADAGTRRTQAVPSGRGLAASRETESVILPHSLMYAAPRYPSSVKVKTFAAPALPVSHVTHS